MKRFSVFGNPNLPGSDLLSIFLVNETERALIHDGDVLRVEVRRYAYLVVLSVRLDRVGRSARTAAELSIFQQNLSRLRDVFFRFKIYFPGSAEKVCLASLCRGIGRVRKLTSAGRTRS